MTIAEAFTKRLRFYLKQKNTTVYEFASKNGLKPDALSDILFNVDNQIAISNVCKVCNALNISIQEFFDCDEFKLENLKF